MRPQAQQSKHTHSNKASPLVSDWHMQKSLPARATIEGVEEVLVLVAQFYQVWTLAEGMLFICLS